MSALEAHAGRGVREVLNKGGFLWGARFAASGMSPTSGRPYLELTLLKP
jgi:hypothetical protein